MKRIILLLLFLMLKITVFGQFLKSYKPGYYYNNSGEKITGLISVFPYDTRIVFKKTKDSSSRKIKIAELKAVVIVNSVNDSLCVMTEDGKDDEKYFAQLDLTTPTMKFYNKFYEFNVGGVPTMTTGAVANTGFTGSQPAFHNTYKWTSSSYGATLRYIMFGDGNTTHKLTKENYIEVMGKAFADCTELISMLGKSIINFQISTRSWRNTELKCKSPQASN
jgi:hypothetical protein